MLLCFCALVVFLFVFLKEGGGTRKRECVQVLSRLCGGVGDTSAEALSAAEFEESVMESPLAFGTFKLVAGAVCRRWHTGLLIDGIGSLHHSAGGPAALACVVQYAAEQDFKYIVCLAVLPAVTWWGDVGGFTILDLVKGMAEKQLQPGCLVKGLDAKQLAEDLLDLSQSYCFRHRVMLRWL